MKRPLSAALKVEALKFRSAPVVWIVSLAVLLLVCGLATGAYALVSGQAASPAALKFRASMHGQGWEGLYSLASQIGGVAVLLGVGVVISWCLGREFTEQTVVGLFALPVSRGRIALSKMGVVLLWASLLSLTLGLLVFLGGLALGLDPRGGIAGGLKLVALGGLMSLSALPVAWVASASRGYLAGIGAVLGLVVFSQIMAAAGGGHWIPWVSPVMWAGAAGTAAAAQVSAAELVFPVVLGTVFAALTAWWWQRAELGNSRG